MNRYGQPLPTISKNYMSAILGRQEGKVYSTYENLVCPGVESNRSNVIVSSGSTLDLYTDPIDTQNFNVIQVSLDTKNSNNDPSDIFSVKLSQGLARTSLDETYESPLLAQSNFFRNYPVANNFAQITLDNTIGQNDLHCNVCITLSKFTQFNPPSQLGDTVEFKSMANLTRNANYFIDDVSRGLVPSVNLINIQGMMLQESSNTHVVCPIEFQVPTSNTYAEVYAVSDSPLDTFELDISGDTDSVGRLGRNTNGITLQGLTPSVISIDRYKSIDLISTRGITNSGNISIKATGTNIPYNYIPKGWANTAAAVYYIQNNSVGVLKEIRVNGYSELHVSRIRAVLQDGDTGIKEIWENRIADGNIDRLWTPDYYIPPNTTLYVEMEGHSPVGNDQEINVECKILEYMNRPEKSDARPQ
jgi:hypothetical protein